MHDPTTREAFATAHENVNGYFVVSEPVSNDMIEGVFASRKAHGREFPWNPKCRLDKAENME